MKLNPSPSKTIQLKDALRWIAEVFEEAPENIQPHTPRSAIPSWDSLGILSLMAGLDEKFDLRLTEAEIKKLQSVKDLLDILRQHGYLAD